MSHATQQLKPARPRPRRPIIAQTSPTPLPRPAVHVRHLNSVMQPLIGLFLGSRLACLVFVFRVRPWSLRGGGGAGQPQAPMALCAAMSCVEPMCEQGASTPTVPALAAAKHRRRGSARFASPHRTRGSKPGLVKLLMTLEQPRLWCLFLASHVATGTGWRVGGGGGLVASAFGRRFRASDLDLLSVHAIVAPPFSGFAPIIVGGRPPRGLL